MAENISFISAADLPEAVGDDVSVICLEDGELKQKPGASVGGGEPLLCRTYTSEDIVLGEPTGSGEKCIVDEEIVRAVFQSINNGTKMPIICYMPSGSNAVYFPTSLELGFGNSLDSIGFSLITTGGVHGSWHIFDTYDHAYDYYNR